MILFGQIAKWFDLWIFDGRTICWMFLSQISVINQIWLRQNDMHKACVRDLLEFLMFEWFKMFEDKMLAIKPEKLKLNQCDWKLCNYFRDFLTKLKIQFSGKFHTQFEFCHELQQWKIKEKVCFEFSLQKGGMFQHIRENFDNFVKKIVAHKLLEFL